MSGRNLRKMFSLADEDDKAEGRVAYERYRSVILTFAEYYDLPLERTLAAFCALSPNNDYYGNLRSLASVMKGFNDSTPLDEITVSTYKHCRDRAYSYITGETLFLTPKRGLKIAAFYRNILNPSDPSPVTIDGHMKAAYEGKSLTMKQAVINSKKEYVKIAEATKRIAKSEGLLPNQVQATIWFARKRHEKIKYNPQLDLFSDSTDKWRTIIHPSEAPPYQPYSSTPT